MKFIIHREIFEKYPGLKIAAVVARDINNNENTQEFSEVFAKKQAEIRSNFKIDDLESLKEIEAWRKAYSDFGAKPKKYKSSVETLYRIILEGRALRQINKIVDIYNFVSIKHILPIGGDDLDKVEGDISLKFAGGNERFEELNSSEIKNPEAGEVIYADEKDVLCRRWNWRECEKTKMTENTKNVLLVIEALSPLTREKLEMAASELGGLIEKFCDGKSRTHILDENTLEIEI